MSEKKIQIGVSDEIAEGELQALDAEGTPVLLTRIDGQVRAVVNRCPHMNMKMTRGKISDGVIVCPWHGSRFEFCTGKNVDWVNAIAGIPMPSWTHKLIAMGKPPAGLVPLPVEETPDGLIVTLVESA